MIFSDLLDFLLEDFILGASFHPGEGESLSLPHRENGNAERTSCEDRRLTHQLVLLSEHLGNPRWSIHGYYPLWFWHCGTCREIVKTEPVFSWLNHWKSSSSGDPNRIIQCRITFSSAFQSRYITDKIADKTVTFIQIYVITDKSFQIIMMLYILQKS